MAEQLPKIGDDVTALMAAAAGDDVTALMRSHEPAEARPIATGGGRGTGLDVRKSDAWLKANAPTIGATLATVATGGGSLPLSMLAAAGGGAAGSGLRGDDAGEVLTQGAIQGGLEGAGGLAVRGGSALARGLMKGTVPKNIAKEFQGQVDIPREMLERGAFPGVPASARRMSGLSTAANNELAAAAQAVPAMPRRKVIEGLRPLHAEAMAGREPEMAAEVLEQMRTSARDIGPTPMSGPEALIRKGIKQNIGNAAVRSARPQTAAFGSQIQDAERGAILSHLRETPRMASALDESQTLMAIDQVMKDAALSNPVTRARIGGATAASLSPVGLGATAHAVNQGSKLADPQLIRALMMLLSDRSGQDE